MDRRDPRPLNRVAWLGAPISTRLAALGIAAAAADLGSVTIKSPAGPAGVTAGDWIEALGVYVVIALYGWASLGSRAEGAPPAARDRRVPLAWVLLATAAITYAFGHGIHLAANSIQDALDRTGGRDAWGVAYLWDERVGHHLVDAARILFVLVLTWLEGSSPAPADRHRPTGWMRAIFPAGALAYGFIYFATAVEGQTVALALPFTLGYAVWGMSRRSWGGAAWAPARLFFTAASIVSLILFVIWGIWHRGFPEFTRTGVL